MSRWESEDRGDDVADEEEEELDGEWELDPNDPSHPDYDLSVDAGYADWEPTSKPLLLRRGTVYLITVLVIIGLLIPLLLRLTY